MKTFSRLLASLLVLALVGDAGPAEAQGMIGTSTCSGGGLSMGAANGTFLRIDCTNAPLTGALTSSNGTFSSTGAAVPLILESGFTATAGVDVGMIFRTIADFSTTDKAFSFRDNTSTELFYATGAGNLGSSAGMVVVSSFYGPNHLNLAGTAGLYTTTLGPLSFISPDEANGAMTAHVFDTTNLATTGDKLLSVKNQGTEKFYVASTGSTVAVSTSYASSFQSAAGIWIAYGPSTTAGVNARLHSAANAAGEYGVVVGTSDTTTAQINFAVCNDCDGTPVYVFEVDGLGNGQLDGNLAVGTTLTSSTNYRIETGGTLTPATGDANALRLAVTLDSVAGDAYGIDMDAMEYTPATTKGVTEINIDGKFNTVLGETYPHYAGIKIDAPTRSSADGTITNVYGMWVIEGTAAAPGSNFSIYSEGTILTTGLIVGVQGGASTEIVESIGTSGTLDFGSIAAGTCADLTQAITGVEVGDPIACGWPVGLSGFNLAASCWVIGADSVNYRLCNPTVGAIDPTNGMTFSARTIR